MTFNKQINLSSEWDFAYLPEWDFQKNNLPLNEEFCAKMPMPGFWDDNLENLRKTEIWRTLKYNPTEPLPIRWPSAPNPGDISLPFIIGVGFYRKKINVTQAEKDRFFSISFGGAILETWVFLNGKLVGNHFGPSTPFDIQLPELINKENEIIIVISNTRTDRRGSGLRGYHGRSAGIRGNVLLQLNNSVQIENLFLSPTADEKGVSWKVNVKYLKQTTKKINVNWKINSKVNGEIIGTGKHLLLGSNFEWETERFGLLSWSDVEPNLYEVEIELYDGEILLDGHKQSFGYRTFKNDNKRLYLNNQPVYLRGTTEHHYFPLTCTAPSDILYYREICRRLKSIGFNWIRFHTWVPPMEYLQAADEIGLLVQIEPPVGSTDNEWQEIIKACRQHPSVVLYCVGNEGLMNEANIELAKKWGDFQKKLSPEVLFSPQESLKGVEYGDMGVEAVQEPFPHNPKRLNALREFSNVLQSYSNDMSHNTIRGNWQKEEKRFSHYQRPIMVHELGIHGGYLDIGLEHRYEGTRIGAGLFTATREHLKENGLLNKAAIFYQNACAHMRIQRKYAIEIARKCQSVSGYDLLGATDAHWHRTGYECGVMNEFYELKHGESKNDVLKYNGESVLLLDCGNQRNFFENDSVKLPAMISHFGNRNIENGVLTWLLKDRESVLLNGNINCQKIKMGDLASLGSINFNFPSSIKARKVTLVMRFLGGGYDIENEWNFWVFPHQQKEVKPSIVETVIELTPAVMQKIKEGASIIYLGSKPFPSSEIWFMSSSSGRAGGHKGTIVHDHPLTRHFPHDGFFDLQFFNMLDTDCNPILFDDKELPFNPIIELISAFKRVRKMSVLFEYAVGKGKLLVCSLNLKNKDAGTEYFKTLIHQYAASSDFNPQTIITPTIIENLISASMTVEKKFTTDEGDDPNAKL